MHSISAEAALTNDQSVSLDRGPSSGEVFLPSSEYGLVVSRFPFCLTLTFGLVAKKALVARSELDGFQCFSNPPLYLMGGRADLWIVRSLLWTTADTLSPDADCSC